MGSRRRRAPAGFGQVYAVARSGAALAGAFLGQIRASPGRPCGPASAANLAMILRFHVGGGTLYPVAETGELGGFDSGVLLLDKYRVLRELGSGGMSMVLLAEHVSLG